MVRGVLTIVREATYGTVVAYDSSLLTSTVLKYTVRTVQVYKLLEGGLKLHQMQVYGK